jgi:hypothetical protein
MSVADGGAEAGANGPDDEDREKLRWRTEQVAAVEHGPIAAATDALLNLTYHEEDQAWLETYLLSCLAPGRDEQVRALAITCLGHSGRMFGSALNPAIVPALTALLDDTRLGGQAEDALGDLRHYAPAAFQTDRTEPN